MSGAGGPSAASAQCTVLHVDMDAFFAAVEVLDDPSLAGLPVIVGGSGTRGVVASCTYQARAFGVHSAMSSVEARRRCPHAVFVAGRYWRYAEVSARLHEVLRCYTPVVEAIGLDEAFLDVAGATRLLGHPVEIAGRLRAQVAEELGLSCSVGVARTKLLAKLASEAAKPRAGRRRPRPGPGVVVVEPETELEFLHPLPVRSLWGVGPATASRLAGLGVHSVGDLAAVPEDTLCRLLGNAHGRHLASLAAGRDHRVVEPDREAKSIGHEETFAADVHDHVDLRPQVVRMADAVCQRLRQAGLRARTLTVKVRFGDRTTITRAHTVAEATASPHLVGAVALALVGAIEVGPGVRLLGVSASGLTSAPAAQQLSFDAFAPEVGGDAPCPARGGEAAADSGWEEVEAAVAAVRARYGPSAVAPAALVGRRGLSVKRRGDTQWGPDAEPELEPRPGPGGKRAGPADPQSEVR
jgi:DNA polymerase-4